MRYKNSSGRLRSSKIWISIAPAPKNAIPKYLLLKSSANNDSNTRCLRCWRTFPCQPRLVLPFAISILGCLHGDTVNWLTALQQNMHIEMRLDSAGPLDLTWLDVSEGISKTTHTWPPWLGWKLIDLLPWKFAKEPQDSSKASKQEPKLIWVNSRFLVGLWWWSQHVSISLIARKSVQSLSHQKECRKLKKKHGPSWVMMGWWDVKLRNSNWPPKKFSDRSCCKSHPAGRVLLSMQFVVLKHPMLHWPLWCWVATGKPDTGI